MEIKIGAGVECGGERVGSLKRIILEPTSYTLQHIVVDLGGLFEAHEVLVPINRIYESRDKLLNLDMSLEEVKALPAFEETLYVPLDRLERDKNAQDLLLKINPVFLSSYFIPQVPLPPTGQQVPVEKHMDPAEREIRAGMNVYAGETKVGEISEVTLDSSDKRVTSFIISRGWLFKRDVEIPANWVGSIEERGVLLNRTKQQIEEVDRQQHGSTWTGRGTTST